MIDLGVTYSINCRSIILTDDSAGYPSESSEEVLGESDCRFDGNASLFVKDPFAGGDKVGYEVFGRSEIEWE